MSISNKHIGKRLAHIRASLGETMSEMASSAGVSVKTWSRWEDGGSDISSASLATVCKHYGFSVVWVLYGEGPKILEDHEGDEYLDISAHEYALIPRRNVEASAGPGALNEKEDVRYMMAFRRNWVRQELGVPPERLSIIAARGDSMDSGHRLESDIRDGDLLLVDDTVERIVGDAIYVIQFDGHCIVKRIQCMIDGSVQIISANSAFAPQTIPAGQVNDIRIAGRVVYILAGRKV